MSLEIISSSVLPFASPEVEIKKRKVKRSRSRKVSMQHMPLEILEKIFLSLDPLSVGFSLAVCRKTALVGTPRFWNRLLTQYWCSQKEFDENISKKLALASTVPVPQVHFVSYHRFALAVQEVAHYAEWLTTSMHMPFAGGTYLGLTLPHLPIRNALARFYPDRQFYLAAFGAEDTAFHFSALVLNLPKLERQKSGTSKRMSEKKRVSVPRHFFPIGLKSSDEQSHFLLNFKGAKVQNTTEAMLISQAISSLLLSVHTKSALGRLSLKVPGLSSLPPPVDIDRFFIRSTILIAKIPSLAIEFKFERGALADLRMHNPANPWEFVE